MTTPTINSKLLASLAVFRELYNSNKDIYAIIAAFVEELISNHAKHRFDLTTITDLLNKSYEFNIPEAVVKSALKRLDNVSLTQHIYTVTTNKQYSIPQRQTIETDNKQIVNSLISYIADQKEHQLNENDKVDIINSFSSFLLDEGNFDKYTSLISAFVIKNTTNAEFKNKLNRIKEGVILYTGIQFTNVSALGSWKSKLTIFVDTEILFHLAGYNGEVYQKLWDELYSLIKEINNKNPHTIEIKYCTEVKNEIENFFSAAEHVVSGNNTTRTSDNEAMNAIVNGCKNIPDVIQKKQYFFTKLDHSRICIDDFSNYYSEENYPYNLESESIVSEFFPDNPDGLKVLNKTSIRNQGKNRCNFENTDCILITGKRKTQQVAIHLAKKTHCIPLAVNLHFLTKKFWFKLNKGFGGDVISSFDVVVKAQIALSGQLSNSLSGSYDKLQDDYRLGKINKDTAIATLAEIRMRHIRPEDISHEKVDTVLNLIDNSDIEHHIKTKEYDKRQKQDVLFELIKTKKNHLTDKIKQLDSLKNIKTVIAEKITLHTKRYRYGMALLLTLTLLFASALSYINSAIAEILKYTAPLFIIFGLICFIFTKKAPNKFDMFEQLEKFVVNEKRLEKKHNFCHSDFSNLGQEVTTMEKEVKELEQRHARSQ